ncbi:MAG: hypothetical protein J5767_04910 [Paludibacteraceae bacterium]|nr:hypothetical protein [Paludibacteraceae bacterium]
MTKQILTTLSIAALGIASYATTYMQVTTDDGKITYYDVVHVKESKFVTEEVTPDINHKFEYVDLGLPSGTLWATCNVGATTIEGFGDYFAWGETEPNKDCYNMNNYKLAVGLYTEFLSLEKYNSSYPGTIDSLTTLLPEDDAATANWGADWRMPTKEEFRELIDNCTYVGTSVKGVSGVKFTALNGCSVFFPLAGYKYAVDPSHSYRHISDFECINHADDAYYWTSSLDTTYESSAHVFSYCYSPVTTLIRCDGLPVRAVRVEKSSDIVIPADTTLIDSTSNDSSDVALPSSYEITNMQVIKDNMEVVCYDVDHVTDVTFVTEADINHEYVDLGLPSGTLWATCNVGAITPTDAGNCFSWGETEYGTDYYWDGRTKYGNNNDGLMTLLPEDDAATVNWGADWRMPTKEEAQELVDNCKCEYDDGVGRVKLVGPNGNSIVFTYSKPAVYEGYFWLSSLDEEDGSLLVLYVGSEGIRSGGEFIFYPVSGISSQKWNSRISSSQCFNVRPVRSKPLP